MAGALPTTRPNRSYEYDTLLTLKPSGAITASSSLQATGGAAGTIVDLGAGFVEGLVHINITALTVTASNAVKIYVTGTVSDSTFGTDTNIVELLATPTIGDVAARETDANNADDVISTAGNACDLVFPFRNERAGQVYRYIRIYTVVVASGAITYSAQLAIRDGA